MDARMAGQLVEWFGNYEWTLKYAGSKDGFASNAFQSKMSNQPTITVIYSRQTNAATPVDRGTYIFGGYTTKSWLATDHTKRCADAGNGGTNTVNACDFWSACSASSDCTGYSQCGCCTASGGTDCGAGQACTTGACTAGTCACCADNTCETVCSHRRIRLCVVQEHHYKHWWLRFMEFQETGSAPVMGRFTHVWLQRCCRRKHPGRGATALSSSTTAHSRF